MVKLEPMYALTYYEKLSEVKKAVHYHKYIDALNLSKKLPKPLRITNMEAPLTEEQVRYHFALIDSHSADIVADPQNALKRFARGVDFYLVQDFDSSIDDFTQSILLDGNFFPAYFMRALVRYKQLDYKKAEALSDANLKSGVDDKQNSGVTAVDYEVVKKDLDKVIELAPDFVYGYYNRANVSSALRDYRTALEDYNKAIELNNAFGLFRLGWLYKEGMGVKADRSTALTYLEKAMAAGSTDAIATMAALYEESGNYSKALTLLEEGANKQNATAMFQLSDMYLRGLGVKQNFLQAKVWEGKAMTTEMHILSGYNSLETKAKEIYNQLAK